MSWLGLVICLFSCKSTTYFLFDQMICGKCVISVSKRAMVVFVYRSRRAAEFAEVAHEVPHSPKGGVEKAEVPDALYAEAGAQYSTANRMVSAISAA